MNSNHARSWQPSYGQATQTNQSKKVVVKVSKNGILTKGEKIIYTFFAAVLVAAALYMVSYSSSLDTLNRDVQTLETKMQEIKADNETLSFEVRDRKSVV